MPNRIKSHVPARVGQRKKPAAPSLTEKARGNAFQRGYCDARWFAIRKKVLLRDAYQCTSCKKVCHSKGDAQVDHIIPKDHGGSDDESNLQVLCRSCHSRKTMQEHRSLY